MCSILVMVVVAVMLVPVHISLRPGRSKPSVLGTMIHAEVYEASLTVLRNCFLQAGIVGDDVSRMRAGRSFARVCCQFKL